MFLLETFKYSLQTCLFKKDLSQSSDPLSLLLTSSFINFGYVCYSPSLTVGMFVVFHAQQIPLGSPRGLNVNSIIICYYHWWWVKEGRCVKQLFIFSSSSSFISTFLWWLCSADMYFLTQKWEIMSVLWSWFVLHQWLVIAPSHHGWLHKWRRWPVDTSVDIL